MHILLAEDNPVNQKVALRMLERIGFEADVANNGVEAMNALETQYYDIILMDMQMPEMDGLEATRRIVEKYPEAERPYIIALTANAMQGDRERCISAGMNDYISKPIRMEDLQEAFDRCPVKREESSGDAMDNQDDESAIDFKVLDELVSMLGDDIEFASGLITDFLEDGVELVGIIRNALERGHAVELERAAHTLKSSSATFGATQASILCRDLEEIGQSGRLETHVVEKVDLLEKVFKAVSQALQAYITRQTA